MYNHYLFNYTNKSQRKKCSCFSGIFICTNINIEYQYFSIKYDDMKKFFSFFFLTLVCSILLFIIHFLLFMSIFTQLNPMEAIELQHKKLINMLIVLIMIRKQTVLQESISVTGLNYLFTPYLNIYFFHQLDNIMFFPSLLYLLNFHIKIIHLIGSPNNKMIQIDCNQLFLFLLFNQNSQINLQYIKHINQMDSDQLTQFQSQTDLSSFRDDLIEEGFNKLNIAAQAHSNSQTNADPKVRSWKINNILEEISFGNTVLDQHKKVIKKSLQNFSESLKSMGYQNCSIAIPATKKNNLKILITKCHLLQEKQSNLFCKQLECEELFEKILTFSVQDVSQDFAYQIICVAYLLWEKYIQIRKKYMEDEEMIIYAQSFLFENFQKIILDPRVNILSGRCFEFNQEKNYEVMRSISKKLLKILSQTFLLVIEGFAINPNSQSNHIISNKFKMNAAPYQLYSLSSDDDSQDCEETQIHSKCTKKQKN